MHAIKWQDIQEPSSSNSMYSSSYCEFIDELSTLVYNRFQPQEADLIVLFAKYYFVNSPLVELSAKHIDDIYGELISTWHFIQQVEQGKAKIRVINPTVEQAGWQSSHTLLEVLAPDMPFIIDSLRLALNRENIQVHAIVNTVLYFDRDDKRVVDLALKQTEKIVNSRPEAVAHLVIGKQSNEQLSWLEAMMESVLAELAHGVNDFKGMLARIDKIEQEIKVNSVKCVKGQVKETEDFLAWLRKDHFTFLGYREYNLVREGDDKTFQEVEGSSLGILRENHDIDVLEEVDRNTALCSDLLVFAKSSTRSRIHRPAYFDIVLIKKFDDKGNIIGEYRILGHYTARVYSGSPSQIPFIREKLKAVVAQSGFQPRSYDGKELQRVLAAYPRDELFQISSKELFEHVLGISHIKERPLVKLFVRQDHYGRFISCLIFAPRDRYSTELREKFQRILCQVFLAEDVEFNAYFSESILTRVHIVLRVRPGFEFDYNVLEIEQRLLEAYRSWDDDFAEALTESCGEEQGAGYAAVYTKGFSVGYKEDFIPKIAVCDINKMERITESDPVQMSLYRSVDQEDGVFRFKLFHLNKMIPLSDIIPVLENLGLRILGEKPYLVERHNKTSIWVHDFSVCVQSGVQVRLDKVKHLFQTAFIKIWYGDLENDGFNRLVLAARLDWRQIALFRSYAKYLKQINFPFSQTYIEETLAKNTLISREIFCLFDCRFNPAIKMELREKKETACLEKINTELDGVENLDEDRILRRYVDVILGTLRTNFYQIDQESNEGKAYISLKFQPDLIPDIPLPVPSYEIFVYSPRVEGVHLRGGKVARGGLRWSDRKEDFRTEVLGLVKAQQVKNTVIVPVGAKGGFVVKCLPENGTRDEVLTEVIRCYRFFIAGMLDITDNMVDGNIIVPDNVIRKDGDDSYLVVAADKGTATFSDIANEMSKQYNFWLGDAFASGGSEGYDHKKMGITAKGAWVSVRRHFREIDHNVQETDFSVVGVGDMAGDVFGNGMLLSEHIRLLAAFNHMHIFIDPDPDVVNSFEERKRLFGLPRSSWLDYNKKLISKGGGVFLRTAKYIDLSPEIREQLDISKQRLTPNELICEILKSPVDLIWNGGIGTYVKSSSETHGEVGDKSNDSLRVNANQLRCKVFGEGGNLGITQLGRVECASAGVMINTDFIDNAGGVDCSDHEVNIKILLNEVLIDGDITNKQRNKLLVDMTDEISTLVLANNYQQVQAISIAQTQSVQRIDEYRRFIQSLESNGRLNRALEFLPSEDEINERKVSGQGLTRPELSILLSYSKSLVKQKLAESLLCDDAYIAKEIATAFPNQLVEQYWDKINQHRLRKEIVATQVANSLVNYMGITYIQRMVDASGASELEIARAFVAARDIFQLDSLWKEIQALDYQVKSSIQIEMMIELIRVVRRGTRWFLRNRRGDLNVKIAVGHFGAYVSETMLVLPDLLKGPQREAWETRRDHFVEEGVPESLASVVACSTSLLPLLGIIEAADITRCKIEEVAEVYFLLGDQLDLHWFSLQINLLRASNHWEALAREAYRDDLDWQQRALTVGVLNCSASGELAEVKIQRWKDQHASLLYRWQAMMTELRSGTRPEFAMCSVALRELLDIAQSTAHINVD